MSWGDLPEHVHAGVDQRGVDECWEWRKSTCRGYAMTTVAGVHWYVHRLAYVAVSGAIPDGMVIDHLCRNRRCSNPTHLEAVTHAENIRRGARGAMTHCARGHTYTEETTHFYRRGASEQWHRKCRVCRHVLNREKSVAAGKKTRRSKYDEMETK